MLTDIRALADHFLMALPNINILDPMTAIFEKPADDERQHLKALFVKGTVDG